MTKLSDYVMDFIAGQGIRDVFMLPGGGAMHLNDSLGRHPVLRFVCNLHEQGTAVAAEAYAQYRNDLSVALVTTGPGGTNTITGVASAWLDSIPVLFVSGQVKRADCVGTRGVRQMGFQEIDIVGLVSPLTKYAVTVNDPQDIRYHLEKAAHLAGSGRPGPVWIDIPLDVQAASVDPGSIRGFDSSELPVPPEVPLEELVAGAIRLLNASERPVILAGNGIRLSGALDSFLEVLGLLGIPVLTTWKAMDFLAEYHPLFCGRPGAIGQRGANFTQQNSDWFLSVGARLDFGQTGYEHNNFARAAKKVVVDIDQCEIAKLMMPVEVGIPCDAKAFCEELLRQKDSLLPRDRSLWLERCKDWQRCYPVILPEYRAGREYVNPYVLVDVLSEQMTGADLLVPGSSGACSEVTMQAFRVKKGMRVFNSEGLGSMGFGVPASLGACLAAGGRRTVCVDGDGGFHMNSQELEVIRRLNLPVKIFVLNNSGYGSIRISQRNYFGGLFTASSPESGASLPDIGLVAKAYGIPSRRISNHDRIDEQVSEILDADGPVICEVVVDPDQVTAPKLSSMQRPDGTMVSKPLEDLWPFLDREEFRANMIVEPLED